MSVITLVGDRGHQGFTAESAEDAGGKMPDALEGLRIVDYAVHFDFRTPAAKPDLFPAGDKVLKCQLRPTMKSNMAEQILEKVRFMQAVRPQPRQRLREHRV